MTLEKLGVGLDERAGGKFLELRAVLMADGVIFRLLLDSSLLATGLNG